MINCDIEIKIKGDKYVYTTEYDELNHRINRQIDK